MNRTDKDSLTVAMTSDKQGATPTVSDLVSRLLSAFYLLFEDSEEVADLTYKFDGEQWDALVANIERLEHALPDEPGYVCDYPQKARYAISQLERELAQAREGWIEECAKVCDGEAVRATICVGKLSGADMAKLTAESLAEAIRALKRSRGGAT